MFRDSWSYPNTSVTVSAVPPIIDKREWVTADGAGDHLGDDWDRNLNGGGYNGSRTGPGEDED